MPPILHLHRAKILIEQQRYDLALQELYLEIAGNPDNAHTFSLIAQCESHLKMPAHSLKSARHAIHVAPDYPYGHYMMGYVLDRSKDYRQAETAVRKALSLAPMNASYFALLSQILVHSNKWKQAIEAAENGLRIDAENTGCANMRAIALVKLGRGEEAWAEVTRSLSLNPENAYTHAAQGWVLLEIRKPAEARLHFREALRIAPNNEWARLGLLHALRARNPLYRILLSYSFWISRLSMDVRHLVVVLEIAALILLLFASVSIPHVWKPIVIPIVGAYAIFVYMTLVTEPLFNLVLRLDPFGKAALSRQETLSTYWFGTIAVMALTAGIGFLVTGIQELIPLCIACVYLTILTPRALDTNGLADSVIFFILLGMLALFILVFAFIVISASPIH